MPASTERFLGFLLEVKRPGADVSPEQKQKIMEIRLGYHLAIAVVDSVDALDAVAQATRSLQVKIGTPTLWIAASPEANSKC